MNNLKEIIKEVLEEYLEPTLIIKENVEVSEALQYHIDVGIGTLSHQIRGKGWIFVTEDLR